MLTALSLAGLSVVLLSRRVTALGIAAAALMIAGACGIGGRFGLAAYGYVDVLMAACVVIVLAAPACLRSPRVALAVSVLGFAGTKEAFLDVHQCP
ncbi:MAG: hypothetical protein WAV54_00910 [Acidimicrobiales bacterium]